MNIGEHEAKCIDYAMGFDKNGGKRLELLMESQDGQTGNVFLSFSGKAKDWSLKKMAALGWVRGQGLDGLKTKPVLVRAFDDDYGGKTTRRHDIVRGEGFEIGGGLMTKDSERMTAQAAQDFLDNLDRPASLPRSEEHPHAPRGWGSR